MRNEKPLRSFVFLWTCRLLSLKLQANICFVSGNKSIASLSTISYSSGGDTQSLKALRPQTALDDFHPHKNPPWEKLMEDGCWECFWKEKDLRLTTGGNVRPPAVKCIFSPRRSVICNLCIVIRQSCKKHTVRVTKVFCWRRERRRRRPEASSWVNVVWKSLKVFQLFCTGQWSICPTFGDVGREYVSLSWVFL